MKLHSLRFARLGITVLPLLIAVAGCGGCSGGASDVGLSIPDLSPVIAFAPFLSVANGLRCNEAHSSWRCTSARGDRVALALYAAPLSGIGRIEMVNDAGGTEARDLTFTWSLPAVDRLEFGPYVATFAGSLFEGRLRFDLSGDGFEGEAFECDLATGTEALLDANCDDVIDPHAIATPTWRFQGSPTATHTRTAVRQASATPTPTPDLG